MNDDANAPLPDHVRAFLAPPRFATIATAGEDGRPNQSVAWYRLEPDGTILLNSRDGRRWPADLRRDQRLSMAVIDERDGNRWVGLAGEVVSIDESVERAREDIVALAHRYHPDGPDPDDLARFRTQPRVTFRVRVVRVHDHLED